MSYSIKDIQRVLVESLSPEIERFFETEDDLFLKMQSVNPHPWLTNIRDYAKMLNGDIEIPHESKFEGGHGGFIGCWACLEASVAKHKFESHKIHRELDEEMRDFDARL